MKIIYWYDGKKAPGTIVVLYKCGESYQSKRINGGWKWVQTDRALKKW